MWNRCEIGCEIDVKMMWNLMWNRCEIVNEIHAKSLWNRMWHKCEIDVKSLSTWMWTWCESVVKPMWNRCEIVVKSWCEIPPPTSLSPTGWSYSIIYCYIGGWGCESNREIVPFVRACERSCVCPRDDVVSVAGRFFGKGPLGRGAARRVPFPVVGLAVINFS